MNPDRGRPDEAIERAKPLMLYHASSNRNITEFEPRAKRVRHPAEGPVVFAASDIAQAAQHMVDSDDSWAHIGQSNGVAYAIFSDREHFNQVDSGGIIYALPSESFSVEQPDEHPDEWTSRTVVKPMAGQNIEYASGLDAMIDNGVQVFFTDPAILEKLRHADPVDRMVQLNALQSENERLGRQVKKFPIAGEED